MEYKYRNLKSEDKLYDDYDISGSQAVYAEYARMDDINPEYAGNPLIEALPFYMSPEELAMSNLHIIRVPSEHDIKTKPLERLLSSISALDSLVIPMRWHYELQRELYWCMCRAYLRRHIDFDAESAGCPITFKGNETREKYHISFPMSEGNVGFSVLGISGCGKSKAVELALSHIPQTIVHFSGTPKQFIQIPYLYVVLQKSNLAGLWNGVAEALDKALGNDIVPVYHTMMRKLNRLNDKLEYAARLCTIFKVGVIIIDEIEFLKSTTRRDTFEDLLSFNNMTGIALAVVGTATDKMNLFPTFQMCRRFGKDIDASEYCRNREEYYELIQQIKNFQCFSNKVTFTNKMKEALFEESNGTVGLTVAIFKEMNRRYITDVHNGKEPKIDAEFIHECAKSNSLKAHERVQIDQNIYHSYSPFEAKEKIGSESNTDNDSGSNSEERSIPQRITDITNNIKDKYKLNEDTIRKTIANIILAHPSLTDGEVEASARSKLDDMKPPVKAKPKKKPYYSIENAYKEIISLEEE